MMEDIRKHISLTLKALRKEQGWSLDKAAEETGVSKAMLGQIERGESSPTVATLWKIATGFRTSFSSFIEDINTNFNKPIYSRQTQRLFQKDEKFRVTPLFPFDNELDFEIYLIELQPGCEHLSPAHQQGVIEHTIVIEGKMEILVNNRWQTLNEGEGLRFNANQPHGYRNTSSKITCFHDIVHYTKS